MVFDKGSKSTDSQESVIRQQRFMGKIQYIKVDHGYIRSKSKINGVRDITFNLLDIPRNVQKSLNVGDLVSFRVNFFHSGKFCAVDVQREFAQVPSTRSSSPVSSISSIESLTDSASIQSIEKTERSNSYVLNGYKDPAYEFRPLQTIQYREWIPSKPALVVEKMDSPSPKTDVLSQAVDRFMEKVISRKFNPHFSSCWLEF